MKKILMMVLLILSCAYASSSDKVFQKSCSSCHVKSMEISDMGDDIKAPPMNMISMRLKSAISTKKEFVAFVKDYIQNPSQEKGHCMKMAYKKFGVMPPVGKGMSKEDIDEVANWLYDSFSGSSSDGMGANMKCGAGKCGSR